MESILEFLGFTSTESTIWNLIGYGAFIAVIIAVLFEKVSKPLFFFGPLALALYAGFFLKDPLFTSLQIVITISGALRWLNVGRENSIILMVFSTLVAIGFLAFFKYFTSIWPVVGSIGLLGIAFGIIRLPKPSGNFLMAVGGFLLVLYAWTIGAWVFFFLNIFFTLANLQELLRKPTVKEEAA